MKIIYHEQRCLYEGLKREIKEHKKTEEKNGVEELILDEFK